jgi:hypothetical protein
LNASAVEQIRVIVGNVDILVGTVEPDGRVGIADE